MDLRLDMPGLSGNVEKDVKNLSNYVFQLSEQLRYLLYNLDVTNFNDLGLARYENGRMQIYTEKLQAAVNEMEIKLTNEKDGLKALIEADANALKLSFENAEKDLAAQYKASAEGLSGQITQELGAAKNGIDEKVAGWQLTVDGFSTSFTTKLNEVDQTMTQWTQDAERFKAYVETAEGKIASWEITENKINSLVTAIGSDGSILSSQIRQEIKDDKSFIKLIANEVDIDGLVAFTNIKEGNGQTEIDGAYILSEGENSWDYVAIDGGYIELGANGYIGQYDEGIVRLKAGRLRLDGDTDVIIAGYGANNGAVYIYCYRERDPDGAGFGWRFNSKSIDYRPIGSDTWTPVLEV